MTIAASNGKRYEMNGLEIMSSPRNGAPGSGGRRFFAAAVKIAVLAVLFYFWYRYIKNNREDLLSGDWRVGWGTAALSTLFMAIGYLIRSCLWAPMRYELTGERMSLADSFRVSAISWMGRYVPGKIWTVAGKAWLSSKDKSRVPALGMAVIVEILWFQLAGVLIAVVMLIFSGGHFFSAGIRMTMMAILAAGLVASHPRVFIFSTNRVLRLMRRPLLTHRPRYRAMLLLMLANVATFVFWGISFLVLARGVSPLGINELPYITGIFSAAWVVGFFMILVPAGIGVRESILMFGLRGMGLADPVIITLVLASRILMTLVEFVFFLAAVIMSFGGERRRIGGRTDNNLDSRH